MANSKINISYIIAVYNKAQYINRLIENITNQIRDSNIKIEIIFINDCSSDNSSLQIIETMQNFDITWKLINNEKNLGPAKSLNIAAASASGEYFAFMDADDAIIFNAENILYNTILKTESQWGFCNVKKVNNNINFDINKYIEQISPKKIQYDIIDKDCLSKMISNYRLASCYFIISSHLFQIMNGFDDSIFVQDVSIFLRASYFCQRYIYIKNQLYVYCKNNNCLSSNRQKEHTNGFMAFENFLNENEKNLPYFTKYVLYGKQLSILWKNVLKNKKFSAYFSKLFVYYFFGIASKKIIANFKHSLLSTELNI